MNLEIEKYENEIKKLRKAAKASLKVLERSWGYGDPGTREWWDETIDLLYEALENKPEASQSNLTNISEEKRSILPTKEAAKHLNRKEQTLRMWACQKNGPLQPVNLNGRLAWRTDDIRRLLQMSQ